MKRPSSIAEVPGIKVGHASDFRALTGCTVILCEEGATGAIDIRGSAAATRQVDALRELHLVDEIHALLLSGGSAYGLDAAGGVMSYLEEKGKGLNVGKTTVPSVPAAVIFDLGIGDFRVRPDRQMGYQACQDASTNVREGSVGAGTGATVGKLFGVERAMKGGVGTSCVRGPNGLLVGALAVVNAFGDVVDPRTGEILAGARVSEKSLQFACSSKQMKRGVTRKAFQPFDDRGETIENTTLGVIATNASLSKREIKQALGIAHCGLAKVISPLHTTSDGDLLFGLSCGTRKSDVNLVGLLAEEALMEAVHRAVKKADGLGVIPAYKDRLRKA